MRHIFNSSRGLADESDRIVIAGVKEVADVREDDLQVVVVFNAVPQCQLSRHFVDGSLGDQASASDIEIIAWCQ